MPVVKREPLIDNLRLRDFFKDDVYSIPSFQRDYAWGKSEAKDLVSDLHQWYTDEEPTPYYLMGQVVVVRDEQAGGLQIVDGQQRITTLFLLLLAIDHRLAELNFRPKGVRESLVQSQLTSSIVIEIDEGRPTARLQLSDSGNSFQNQNQEFLVKLISKENTLGSVIGATQANLLGNLKIIESELATRFSQMDDLFDFLERIMAGVYLGRLEVESIPQALDIFEKLNNRGLNLSSADLLKNLLFQKSDIEDYDYLSTTWAQAAQTIFQIRPKRASTMEFLVKAMIAAETGRSIPSSRVYREWSELFKESPERVSNFRNAVEEKSKALQFLSQRKRLDGTLMTSLHGAVYFGSVQHFTVLLAGTHLNNEAFEQLVKLVEDRTVLSIIARERSQDFERMLPEWSNSIHKLSDTASPSDVFENSSRGLRDVSSLLELAKLNLSKLQYSRSNDLDQIRYILTRISVRIESFAKHNTETLWKRGLIERDNGAKPEKPFDIEHVSPQSAGALVEIGEHDWKQGIGNLVLMHYSDNRSAGANDPAVKIGHYNSSELLLTRSLCDAADLGVLNRRLERIVAKMQGKRSWALSNWDSESALAREALYWDLLNDEFTETFKLEPND
jgi:hypothetical protein